MQFRSSSAAAVVGRGLAAGSPPGLAAPPWWPATASLAALYTADPAGVALDGDGNVKQLLDLSGNGNSGPVQMAALRPTWNLVGAIGGRPSITCDGFSTYLLTGTVNLASPCTVIVVASSNSAGGCLTDGVDSSARELLYTDNGGTFDYYYGPTLGPVAVIATVVPTGAVVVGRRDGTNASVTVGAATASAAETASADVASALTVGASYSSSAVLDGDIALVACFSAALTTPQLAAWRAAILTRFGV
jgi:hypothetical protein